MNAVSLFAGAGGIDLALQRNGVDVVAAVEIDSAARGVLRHQFPNTRLFNDVRTVTGDELLAAGFNPSDGIIVGGFPCQDLSVAGKRAGLDGARSGLFWEIIRLIDELNPKWLILENVPGLLSSNGGRDMGTVIGALVDRGYGIAYRILDAQHFGVPQRRRRVVIVGCFGDDGRTPGKILDIEGTRSGDTRKNVETITEAAPTSQARADRRDEWLTFSKVRRAQNVEDFETWMQRGFTNTLNLFDNAGATRATELIIDNSILSGSCVECGNDDSTQDHPFCMDCLEAGAYATHRFLRRMTPKEFERLQGFPDNWSAQRWDEKKQAVVDQADSARYKQIANAVAVPVFEWVIDRLVAHDEAQEVSTA